MSPLHTLRSISPRPSPTADHAPPTRKIPPQSPADKSSNHSRSSSNSSCGAGQYPPLHRHGDSIAPDGGRGALSYWAPGTAAKSWRQGLGLSTRGSLDAYRGHSAAPLCLSKPAQLIRKDYDAAGAPQTGAGRRGAGPMCALSGPAPRPYHGTPWAQVGDEGR